MDKLTLVGWLSETGEFIPKEHLSAAADQAGWAETEALMSEYNTPLYKIEKGRI